MINKKGLNLRQVFGSIFFVVILFSGLLGGITFQNFSKMKMLLQGNELNTQEYSEGLLHLKGALGFGGFIQNYKNFLLTSDISFYKEMEISKEDVINSIGHIKMSEFISDTDADNLRLLLNHMRTYTDKASEIKEMYERGENLGEVASHIEIDDSKALEALASLDHSFHEMVSAGTRNMSSAISNTLITILVSFALISLALLLLIHFLYKKLSRQFKRMSSVAGAIAEGNISEKIDVLPTDAAGDMARSFNRAMDSLLQIVMHIKSNVELSRGGSELLSETIGKADDSTKSISDNMSNSEDLAEKQVKMYEDISSSIVNIYENIDVLTRGIDSQVVQISQSTASMEEISTSIKT